MTANISFRIENNILMCFVTGERNSQSVLEYWQKLINKCHQEGIYLVQLTIALRGKFDPVNAIECYQAIIEMIKPTNLKVACVDLNHLSAPDTQVSCKMGIIQGINVCFFDSEDTAKQWLIDGSNSNRSSYKDLNTSDSKDIEKQA